MKKFELKIERDYNPMNPRTEWDNITTMVCIGKYGYLGDKHNYKQIDFETWEELKEQIESDNKVLMIKPLYVYEHGGVTISSSRNSCSWDSSRIGWVFIGEKELNSMCGKDYEITEDKLNSIIEGDIETYDKYLQGDVYQYKVYEIETCNLGCEHKTLVENCGGYYDEEDCKSEGESILNYLQKELVGE